MSCEGFNRRPLGFLLGLFFSFLSILVSIVGIAIWIAGLVWTFICPCCVFFAIIMELGVELIKAPIRVMELFAAKIPF